MKLSKIPKAIRQRAIQNKKELNGEGFEHNPHMELGGMFTWSSSKEGTSYWSAIDKGIFDTPIPINDMRQKHTHFF